MKKCEFCGSEHDGSYGSGRFCCAVCARKYSNTYVTKEGRKNQIKALNDKAMREMQAEMRRLKSKNFKKDEHGNWVYKRPKTYKNLEDYINTKLGFMHPVHLGNIGEVAAIKLFLQYDIPVYKPITDFGIDLVVYINNEFKKIQIKSSTRHSNDESAVMFNLASQTYKIKNGKVISKAKTYSADMIDYFILYDAIYDELFIFPNITGNDKKSSVILRYNPTKNGQTEGIKYAKDYLLEKYLQLCTEGINPDNIIDVVDKNTEDE